MFCPLLEVFHVLEGFKASSYRTARKSVHCLARCEWERVTVAAIADHPSDVRGPRSWLVSWGSVMSLECHSRGT